LTWDTWLNAKIAEAAEKESRIIEVLDRIEARRNKTMKDKHFLGMQQDVANTQKALDKPCNICGKVVHNGWHYGVHSPTQGLTWRQTDDTPYSHQLIKYCEECKQKQIDYFSAKRGNE
jgi:hypothetical protein